MAAVAHDRSGPAADAPEGGCAQRPVIDEFRTAETCPPLVQTAPKHSVATKANLIAISANAAWVNS
jgi:hypothetical protein